MCFGRQVNAYTGDVPGIKTTHWVGSEDLLSIKFQDKSEHTVRGGMLRTKIIAMNWTATSGGGDYAKAAHPKFTVGTDRQQVNTFTPSKQKRKRKTHR
jgi:hypothetical protein